MRKVKSTEEIEKVADESWSDSDDEVLKISENKIKKKVSIYFSFFRNIIEMIHTAFSFQFKHLVYAQIVLSFFNPLFFWQVDIYIRCKKILGLFNIFIVILARGLWKFWRSNIVIFVRRRSIWRSIIHYFLFGIYVKYFIKILWAQRIIKFFIKTNKSKDISKVQNFELLE